jgi:Mg-chelatase subunit ChlD
MALNSRLTLLALLLALLAALIPPGRARAEQGALDASYSDVVLVIDNSGSMRKNDPAYLRLAAAKLFIDLADPNDKIGIVVMSDQKRTRALTDEMLPVKNKIDKLKSLVNGVRDEPMGQETHMGTALAQAYTLLDTTSRQRDGANQHQFVVLLTDGLPTGDGQREQVDQAAGRFRERRYWKIFAIALGAEADPDYLRRAVADPSGGEVLVARHDSDLLDSYLDVYARTGDDRFIDRVTVQPNTLAPLVDVQADQQPTQLSVVLVRGNPKTRIDSLQAPESIDVVQPYYQNTVRRGAEPEYELYIVPAGAQVGLTGRWMINVERQDPAPAAIVVLSRSRLRTRLAAPAPTQREDDSSLRYQPLGRPLLLIAGAEVAERNDSGPLNQPYIYRRVTGMAPVAQVVAPTPGQPVRLSDDGREYDASADDGHYTGVYPPLAAPGDYRLRLEVPRQTGDPIHLHKEYIIRVAVLPTMTLTLPPAATTLPINQPFSALIDLPGRADFQIDSVSFPTAFVRRPDGVLDRLAIEPAGAGRFRFQYTPGFAGSYRISLVADVQGRGPVGAVHYVDYAEASAAVPEAVPTVAISAAFTQTLTYDGSGALNVPLTIDSRSPRQEHLTVRVEGLPGAQAVPDSLLLQPAEAGQRTIAVRLPEGQRPRQGQLAIVFASPEQRVIVQGSRTEVPFRAPGGMLLPALLLLLAAVVVGFFGYWRWRRRRVHALLVPGTPRRVA